MKNTKFRSIYGKGPFFIYTGFRWLLLWWLWLVYWVIGIFFRFILPSLSRGCLAHPVGTHSPRLYFYREPISHLCVCVSVGDHPLYVGCRSTCFPLGNHSSDPSDVILRILPFKQAVHRYRFVSFTHHKSLLRLIIFGYEVINYLLVPMGGIEPPAFRLWGGRSYHLNYMGICTRLMCR